MDSADGGILLHREMTFNPETTSYIDVIPNSMHDLTKWLKSHDLGTLGQHREAHA
jgi:hypothetical protein